MSRLQDVNVQNKFHLKKNYERNPTWHRLVAYTRVLDDDPTETSNRLHGPLPPSVSYPHSVKWTTHGNGGIVGYSPIHSFAIRISVYVFVHMTCTYIQGTHVQSAPK